jgi:hypothetical protein
MTTTTSGRGRRSILTAALSVACAAGVATAHGLFQVAVASRVPTPVAWLYPVITDGLALVAYAATNRLRERGRRYAAVITVVAASLSGLAQAVYLAGGLGHASAAPAALRFGVGFWPAVAAALTAHLLHLVVADPTEAAEETAGGVDALTSARQIGPGAYLPDPASVQPYSAAGVQPSNPIAEHSAVQAARTTGQGGDAVQPECSTSPEPPAASHVDLGRPGSAGGGVRPRDRAQQAARSHYTRHGSLPTVTELMQAAQVARGTAGTVLKDLRDSRPALHIVTTDDDPGTETSTDS